MKKKERRQEKIDRLHKGDGKRQKSKTERRNDRKRGKRW